MGKEEPIIRLPGAGSRQTPADAPVRLNVPEKVERPVAPSPPVPERELPQRLEASDRGPLSGRSQEPGLEQILPESEVEGLSDDPWAQKATAPIVPWGWFVLVGLILTGAIGWSLWQLSESEQKVDSTYTQATEELEKDALQTKAAEEFVGRVEETLRNYFNADSIDELAKWVRHPERVRPLMKSWYAVHPLQRDPMVKMTEFVQLPFDDRGLFWRARIRTASGRAQEVYLEEQPDGSVKIGWETLVGYQPMPWDDYVRNRPGGSMDFRLTAHPDTFYSHEFADSNRWVCYRLTAPKSEEVAYGYVERSHPVAVFLENYFRQREGKPAQLILRLNTPSSLNSPRGMIIEDVRSIRWLYFQNPDGGA
jgi:hypothetical protein